MTDTIKVAVGIVINANDQVLVSVRPDHVPLSGLWEFPGGKIESDESALAALKRELIEEVAVTVVVAKPLICVSHRYEHGLVSLDTYHVTEFSGEPYGKEGQTVDWVPRAQLRELAFPPSNTPIIDAVMALS